jgi:hypothetical protein
VYARTCMRRSFSMRRKSRGLGQGGARKADRASQPPNARGQVSTWCQCTATTYAADGRPARAPGTPKGSHSLRPSARCRFTCLPSLPSAPHPPPPRPTQSLCHSLASYSQIITYFRGSWDIQLLHSSFPQLATKNKSTIYLRF